MNVSNPVNLILLGSGKVGRALVRQILSAQEALSIRGIHFQFSALADSTAAVCGHPLPTDVVQQVLEIKQNGQSLRTISGSLPLDQITHYFTPQTIVIDTSAAKKTLIHQALEKGCRLAFANKNSHSAPWAEAEPFFNPQQVKYEATVGAGLPVIRTLRGLVDTGDEITHIAGVMSGTLGYLCSQLEARVPYSQAVRQAFELGYTEPDPRDDLSGFDVARKALILARTAGWPLEMEHLTVEAFYAPDLAALSVPEFMQALPRLDSHYAEKVCNAAAEKKVLRYMAQITPQGGSIGLTAVEKSSALGALNGPGNFISFTSKRYAEIPLVISGPGAGIEVTAAGVFNDLLDLVAC